MKTFKSVQLLLFLTLPLFIGTSCDNDAVRISKRTSTWTPGMSPIAGAHVHIPFFGLDTLKSDTTTRSVSWFDFNLDTLISLQKFSSRCKAYNMQLEAEKAPASVRITTHESNQESENIIALKAALNDQLSLTLSPKKLSTQVVLMNHDGYFLW